MNKYMLPPGKSNRIEIAAPPLQAWWDMDPDTAIQVAPLATRVLWLHESVYDGHRVMSAYDRDTDTLYLREWSSADEAARQGALEA